MPTTRRLRTTLAAAGLSLGVVGGAAFAVTSIDGTAAATSAATTTASTTTHAARHTRKAAAEKARGLLARTDHATVEVRRDHRWVTISLDRGQVTAVSTASITLRRPDGTSVTVALQPTTRYRGVATSESTVATGRRATVVSESGKALRVIEARIKPASAPTTAA